MILHPCHAYSMQAPRPLDICPRAIFPEKVDNCPDWNISHREANGENRYPLRDAP